MQADIHPSYKEIQVSCSCGNQFNIKSTSESDSLHIDVCDKCHPFYTGKQKVIDTAGRIDSFKKKFAGISAKKSTEAKKSEEDKS